MRLIRREHEGFGPAHTSGTSALPLLFGHWTLSIAYTVYSTDVRYMVCEEKTLVMSNKYMSTSFLWFGEIAIIAFFFFHEQ